MIRRVGGQRTFPSTLQGAGGTTALILVHLDSLDALSWANPMLAWRLAGRIEEAASSHEGPVFVVTQNWAMHDASDARKHLWGRLEALDVIWFTFDEAAPDDEWDEMLPELLGDLRRYGVARAEVGGLWWNEQYVADPETHGEFDSGCASYTFVWLRDHARFPVTARMDLAGLWNWRA